MVSQVESGSTVSNQNTDLPRKQKSKTYKIEEKTSSGWESFWSVVDMKITAHEKFEKVRSSEGEYRLIETLTNELSFER